MTKDTFLLLNLVLAFYNAGTIWAHEVDIFRTWKYLDGTTFRMVQRAHFRKIPYWVFIPVGLSFAGSIVLRWYHPSSVPGWEPMLAFLSLLLSNVLTAVFWGRWQAKLSKDTAGGASIWLDKILKTHWLRTLLINVYAGLLLYMAFQTFK